jgi:ketosteroid isomerase-like protein
VSEQDIAVVRRALDAFARGDSEGFLSKLDPEIEWHPTPGSPVAGVYRGLDDVERLFRTWRDAWHEVDLVLEDPVEANGNVVATGHFHGITAGTAEEVDFRRTAVMTIRDGRIVRVVDYTDRAEALEALGETVPERRGGPGARA